MRAKILIRTKDCLIHIESSATGQTQPQLPRRVHARQLYHRCHSKASHPTVEFLVTPAKVRHQELLPSRILKRTVIFTPSGSVAIFNPRLKDPRGIALRAVTDFRLRQKWIDTRSPRTHHSKLCRRMIGSSAGQHCHTYTAIAYQYAQHPTLPHTK